MPHLWNGFWMFFDTETANIRQHKISSWYHETLPTNAKPPTANRSSGSGRWTLATPQPGAFPNGNQSCPAECTAWWDLKFCIRSCCSRPGSWPECCHMKVCNWEFGFLDSPAEGREIICVFWGSCAMALWASISHSLVYVGISKLSNLFL